MSNLYLEKIASWGPRLASGLERFATNVRTASGHFAQAPLARATRLQSIHDDAKMMAGAATRLGDAAAAAKYSARMGTYANKLHAHNEGPLKDALSAQRAAKGEVAKTVGKGVAVAGTGYLALKGAGLVGNKENPNYGQY